MRTKETIYDEDIAPALLELAKRCEQNGFSLSAICEWEPGKSERTTTHSSDCSFGVRLVTASMQANGNIDALLKAILDYAGKNDLDSDLIQKVKNARDN